MPRWTRVCGETHWQKIAAFVGGPAAGLYAKDASTRTGGVYYDDGGIDPHYVFIGTQAFHHRAGELHYSKHNAPGHAHDKTIVQGDVNGDGRADFQIVLLGLHNLHGNDSCPAFGFRLTPRPS